MAVATAASGVAHNKRLKATCSPWTRLTCASSIYFLLLCSWSRSILLCFDVNLACEEKREIVSRTGFGPVRKTRFRPVLKYGSLRLFDEAAAHSYSGRLGAVGGIELGEDGADVKLDCPLADIQAVG